MVRSSWARCRHCKPSNLWWLVVLYFSSPQGIFCWGTIIHMPWNSTFRGTWFSGFCKLQFCSYQSYMIAEHFIIRKGSPVVISNHFLLLLSEAFRISHLLCFYGFDLSGHWLKSVSFCPDLSPQPVLKVSHVCICSECLSLIEWKSIVWYITVWLFSLWTCVFVIFCYCEWCWGKNTFRHMVVYVPSTIISIYRNKFM